MVILEQLFSHKSSRYCRLVLVTMVENFSLLKLALHALITDTHTHTHTEGEREGERGRERGRERGGEGGRERG